MDGGLLKVVSTNQADYKWAHIATLSSPPCQAGWYKASVYRLSSTILQVLSPRVREEILEFIWYFCEKKQHKSDVHARAVSIFIAGHGVNISYPLCCQKYFVSSHLNDDKDWGQIPSACWAKLLDRVDSTRGHTLLKGMTGSHVTC